MQPIGQSSQGPGSSVRLSSSHAGYRSRSGRAVKYINQQRSCLWHDNSHCLMRQGPHLVDVLAHARRQAGPAPDAAPVPAPPAHATRAGAPRLGVDGLLPAHTPVQRSRVVTASGMRQDHQRAAPDLACPGAPLLHLSPLIRSFEGWEGSAFIAGMSDCCRCGRLAGLLVEWDTCLQKWQVTQSGQSRLCSSLQ